MGSVARRLGWLEEASRERAAAEIRRGWMGLADEEMVALLAPYFHGRGPTPEELEAHEKGREMWSEELIARAVGYRDGMPGEEFDRRMGELLEPVLRRRRAAVYPRVVGMKDGR